MKCEPVELLKQSEKSTVILMRDIERQRLFIQKTLHGRHDIYTELLKYQHPYLPEIYKVSFSDSETVVLEEYIEGQTLADILLSEKEICRIGRELCSVLDFLHGKGIIHRDIKPSNIILSKDGHIRLIDFDAARIPKNDVEQDTKLLGTRGYAPPEQYGFSQTDERTDIYSLGVTLEQLLKERARKPHYKKIIKKCTNLDPDKRYQSARKVKDALSCEGRRAVFFALMFFALIGGAILFMLPQGDTDTAGLATLPAPDNPRWDGESGIALWERVPESGKQGEQAYHWKLYRQDMATPPNINRIKCDMQGSMGGNGVNEDELSPYAVNLSSVFEKNGYYYFAVSSAGDGVEYQDSTFVLSDVFHYTGENAPTLPKPTGLKWKVLQDEKGWQCFATWENLDDYEFEDSFNVRIYDKSNALINNNIWTKKEILKIAQNGIWISPDAIIKTRGECRFTVEVLTSRPNRYKSTPMPNLTEENSFSPWLSQEQ